MPNNIRFWGGNFSGEVVAMICNSVLSAITMMMCTTKYGDPSEGVGA